MLRPVFEMSSRTSSAEPTVGRQTQNPISADQRPESDGPRDLAQPATQSAGTGLPPGLPDRQPAGGADNRIPSRNKIAVSHLMGTGSTVDKPLTRTNQPAVKTAAASNNRAISRLQNKDTAFVRQVVPPAAAANIDRSRQAPTTVSKDVLPAKTGDVSVGKINIQVRGQRQAEDDWPAPPRYASHTITEDWEWSCHYGR
jgi:hypothetical protein